MNIAAIQDAAKKVNEAFERLQTLIKEGAIKDDIDAQKHVIAQVIHQAKQVAGIEDMPVTETPAA